MTDLLNNSHEAKRMSAVGQLSSGALTWRWNWQGCCWRSAKVTLWCSRVFSGSSLSGS